MTDPKPERPNLYAYSKSDLYDDLLKVSRELVEWEARAVAAESDLARLRAVEEAAMDVVAADRIDNVWMRDKWIPALRAALREKGVEK